ncbi:MAG TPA: polyhydroxyalkanoic acid system family protein [Thermoanaerobaculia bacterium]|nr:polyhydroxyalkanoic acid system family protein [Thermoanaerobaculia bacterium]
MSELRIETPTAKSSIAELRPALDAALAEQFPGGMLKRQWDGDVLRLSGPGAKGTIVLEPGRLVGEAELGPPASMMRGLIEQKIGAALAKAAG